MKALTIIVALLSALAPGAAAASAQAATTTVTLTFDDGLADQYAARSLLADHGMHATFYVNSGRLGMSGFMSLAQVQALAADGNEIGGHTLTHADLPALSVDDQKRQICDDRVALLADGFAVTSFAYPFSAYDDTTKSIVAQCGYNSARRVGDIVSPGSCEGCPYAETTPPRDPYAIRTPDSIKDTTSLADMEGLVTQAGNHGGGWVVLVMHHVCDGCNALDVSAATLSSFLDWLGSQRAAGAVEVRTMREMMGGDVQPPVPGPGAPPPGSGSNVLQNPSLETDSNQDGLADCWQHGTTGTNTASWALSLDAHTGLVADQVQITSFTSGDRKLVSRQDTGACAPSVRAGHTYSVSAWYKATAPVRIVVYYRSSTGAWTYWAQSAALPASSTWTRGTYTTPVIPSGVASLSVGLSLRSVGTMTVDDLSLGDTDQTPPTVALTSPADGELVRGNVALAASASDASGIDHVDFVVNGDVVATDATAPYTATWDSSTWPDSTVSISARATDGAGNTEMSSHLVTIANTDSVPPEVSLIGPSDGATVHGTVTLSASASDDRALDHVSFLVDGTVVGTAYRAPYAIDWDSSSHADGPAIITAQAVDGAGNATVSTAHLVTVGATADTTPPVSAIACAGGPCTAAWYAAPVRITLAATDASGIQDIRFTTDGTEPNSSSPLYTGSFTLSHSATVKFRATDAVGNQEPTQSQDVYIDATAPASTIACSGGSCSSFVAAPASVTLRADDAESGVARILYTTDGSDPTAGSGSVYSGPVALAATTTVKYAAVDAVGNAEPVNTQQVRVDGTPPATAIACNGAPCGGWYAAPVTVTLAAQDAGSGVAATSYTLDGSDPTAISGTVYGGAFTVGATATAKFRSWDQVGNVEVVQSQAIQIDTIAPTITMTSPTPDATVTGSVYITTAPTDNVGVTRVRFYLDGQSLGSRTVAPYRWKWDTTTVTKGQHTLFARAEDAAGNTTRTPTITVVVT